MRARIIEGILGPYTRPVPHGMCPTHQFSDWPTLSQGGKAFSRWTCTGRKASIVSVTKERHMTERDSIVELTREELVERLEQEALRRRGMSARDLLLAYRRGTLEDPGEVADLLALASLLPENDPLLAAA